MWFYGLAVAVLMLIIIHNAEIGMEEL
jgi:hypothetical protein